MQKIKPLIILIVLFFISSCSSKLRNQQEATNLIGFSFSQNYQDVYKTADCGQDPAVRFIDFTFDKKDSVEVSIVLTTSKQERQISGEIAIVVDEYELTYGNLPDSKLYTETVEVEVQKRYPNYIRGSQGLINAILRSSAPKGSSKISEKQYWNTVKIKLNPEDISLIQNSKELKFVVFTVTCELEIYPTLMQLDDLKRFLN